MSSSSASGVAESIQLRRSSRPSPARKASRMIESPADSRRSVRRRDDDSDTDTSIYQAPTKRKRLEATTDDPSSDDSMTKSSQPRRKLKKPTKPPSKRQSNRKTMSSQQDTQGSKFDASTNDSQAVSLTINLVQDSDEENEKVAKNPKKQHQYDNIRDYFKEMETYLNVSLVCFHQSM
ncbi:hypothetical protein DFH28DRAFT_1081420 [Melampsora americana]|nr:hypothetical protein DFH28DRAFT_1081420 [Melampsora americana]